MHLVVVAILAFLELVNSGICIFLTLKLVQVQEDDAHGLIRHGWSLVKSHLHVTPPSHVLQLNAAAHICIDGLLAAEFVGSTCLRGLLGHTISTNSYTHVAFLILSTPLYSSRLPYLFQIELKVKIAII